jgi:hypothetical protein
VVIQEDERLKAIRDRWIGSSAQRAAARTTVGRRELSLANGRQELRERRERLKRRGLKLEGIVEADDSVWPSVRALRRDRGTDTSR